VFIHIGDRKTVSDKKCIGIFNAETLKMSETNGWLWGMLKDDTRTVAIDEKNKVTMSRVSPFTIMKRTSLDEDIVWRKNHE